ncbi:dTDP-4-dehydrorhamnose 3,5-epimerase [Tolypothrix tenuis PCC 7101]|uniref:dTDP-4-dehydrorhamnose 3,5-epimerase n=1 Tax=Tolypothrix tenuis PCC 7101 TaxID=231146 RepID=A0A1Z4N735_9CYAN|nr:dTDP-4-dehydrorhamnose 3,5-epimerase [Aulosira sp. FACHB-113]BAZ01550.1 dTDP-4-dehydrorhamnose 3,5-epimerase [Tolypothrix tenuis PCC 7101]BAZ74524.1 dTDP-4-dehydrorhamnose 3,5-epimerase [Aulosira laxa NIES-50]
MIFTETKLKGAFIVDLELKQDSRGFFARTFCINEFEAHGLKSTIAQCNVSFNHKQGTLRGMHYQTPPSQETKLVRCIHGAIYDVIIDLRPESPTYLSYIGVELTAENRRGLYIPDRFAHGFQTLTDDTEVMYQMGDFYAPEYSTGYRYDDPAFGIVWPLPISEISEKDLAWNLFEQKNIGTLAGR